MYTSKKTIPDRYLEPRKDSRSKIWHHLAPDRYPELTKEEIKEFLHNKENLPKMYQIKTLFGDGNSGTEIKKISKIYKLNYNFTVAIINHILWLPIDPNPKLKNIKYIDNERLVMLSKLEKSEIAKFFHEGFDINKLSNVYGVEESDILDILKDVQI